MAVPLTTKPNELSRVVQLKREEKRWQTSLGVTISPRQAKLRTTVERGDLMSSTSSVSCKRTESSSSVTTISLDHLEIYKSLVDLMEPDWSDSPLGQVQTAIKQGQNSAPLDILVPAMTQISDRLVISANEIESALIYLVGEQILNTLETHKIRKSLLEAARNLDQDHIPISNFVETLRHYVICGDKAGTFQKKFLFSGHHIPFWQNKLQSIWRSINQQRATNID